MKIYNLYYKFYCIMDSIYSYIDDFMINNIIHDNNNHVIEGYSKKIIYKVFDQIRIMLEHIKDKFENLCNRYDKHLEP